MVSLAEEDWTPQWIMQRKIGEYKMEKLGERTMRLTAATDVFNVICYVASIIEWITKCWSRKGLRIPHESLDQ